MTETAPRRIALLLPPDTFNDRLREIILSHITQRRDWIVTTDFLAPEMLSSIGVEVVVGRFDAAAFEHLQDYADPQELSKSYAALHLPKISLFYEASSSEVPCLLVDDEAVGKCAADFFLARGFRHFGFVGFLGEMQAAHMKIIPPRDEAIQLQRQDAFQRAVQGRADSFSVAPVFHVFTEQWRRPLDSWLQALPKPVAILCASDLSGSSVLQACHARGLFVPEQISVLGVDNVERICSHCAPQLSSVVIPWHRMGEEIVRLLDALFKGGKPSAEKILISPTGIQSRGSTSVMACGDPVILHALALLRRYSAKPGNVKHIFALAALPRRQMDRRFAEVLGRSPSDELARLRVERAQPLLGDPTMKYAEIAQSCGFTSTTHMRRCFLKQTGRLPDTWRH